MFLSAQCPCPIILSSQFFPPSVPLTYRKTSGKVRLLTGIAFLQFLQLGPGLDFNHTFPKELKEMRSAFKTAVEAFQLPYPLHSRIIKVFNSKDPIIFTTNIIVVVINDTPNQSINTLPSYCTSYYDIVSDHLNYHDAITCHGLVVPHFPGKCIFAHF